MLRLHGRMFLKLDECSGAGYMAGVHTLCQEFSSPLKIQLQIVELAKRADFDEEH
jgi:hypothetical protein